MLIDSHCHLDMLPEAELPDILTRAKAAGVGGMVTIGTRLTQRDRLLAIVGLQSNLWCTIGVHPHNAGETEVPEPQAIAALAADPRIVGIGESGLDYFYDKAPRSIQEASFRAHIRAARLSCLPLVIHARDADADMAAILAEEHDKGAFTFVLHCFSSGRALADTGVRLGGYISFSGILTFPKSQALREIAASVPPERLLVETDAPYLAPVPHRGNRNEPAFVSETARVLAKVRDVHEDTLAELTTRNFRRLFARVR